MDVGEADGGRTTRGPQYTKNEADLYESAAAEDSLVDDDSHNPFKQDATQQPILDPDEAALAAVNGTYTTSNEGPKVASTAAAPETTMGPEESQYSADDDDKDGVSSKERRSSGAKRSQEDYSLDAGELGGEDEPLESIESQRVAKRPRRQTAGDNSLVIQPGDTVEDEDRKMQANIRLVGTDIGQDGKDEQGNGDSAINSSASEEEEEGVGVDDDYDLSKSTDTNNKERDKRRPPTKSGNEVGPVPLVDQLTLPKTADELASGSGKREDIPRDVGDDDDDIEAKMDDDYDVENYAEYEDDQDDVGQDIEEDGPDMDERLIVDEELFGPPVVGEDGEDVLGVEHGAGAEAEIAR